MANFILRAQFPDEIDERLPTISHLLIPMSSNEYTDDPFARFLAILGFFLFLIYIVPLYRLAYRIVNEKETRARESMKMMGLQDTSYWMSWLTYWIIIVSIISGICTNYLGDLI